MAYNFLIADDSATMRLLVRKVLDMSGLDIGNIFEAKDGKEALGVITSQWIDLVFADIHMPEMNGMELINEMTKRGMLEMVPVIVISSDGSSARMKELAAKGIREYLRKPISPENIREAVMRVLLPKEGAKNE